MGAIVRKVEHFVIALSACLGIVFINQTPIIAITNEHCFECHSDTVDKKKYDESAHGSDLCTSCHESIRSDEHEGPKANEVKCKGCHDDEIKAFTNSDHGKTLLNFKNQPAEKLCVNCHEENYHYILLKDNENSRSHKKNIAKACGACHESKEVVAKYKIQEFNPYKSYQNSIHGKKLAEGDMKSAVCTDCHGAHTNQKHENPESMLYYTKISATCGECHKDAMNEYKKGKHSSAELGERDAPLCTTCHGEHNLFGAKDKSSLIYKSNISGSCGSCHSSVRISTKFNIPLDRISSYSNSFHGVMTKNGDVQVADCASCHGNHAILPADHPDSTINPKNLGKTCSACHPGSNEKLIQGRVHMNVSYIQEGLEYWVKKTYIFIIVLTIGLMFAHNYIDFRKKAYAHLAYHKKNSYIQRLNWSERIQHIALALSFIGLALTGFALAFPESPFGWPFKLWSGGMAFRWWAHRFLALVMVLLCFYHIYYAFTEKGRKEIPGFLPKKQDFLDAMGTIRYNLGIDKKRPKLGHHNYIGKVEYLSLIWGSVVMIITGVILLFNNWSIKTFSLVVINVSLIVHLFEAILATLAILVWHFYFSIFDPSIYPMNWTWLSGGETTENPPVDDETDGYGK